MIKSHSNTIYSFYTMSLLFINILSLLTLEVGDNKEGDEAFFPAFTGKIFQFVQTLLTCKLYRVSTS
jgi:hypothetical protein